MSYVIVTPARNEKKNIERTIDSVVAQNVLPQQWVIVDDGSTDGMNQLVSNYIEQYPWIALIQYSETGGRERGGRIARVVNYGIQSVTVDYDFIVKLDGDVFFEPDYFGYLLEQFAADPRLGIAGGVCYALSNGGWRLERTPAEHVRGATKMYRKTCFEEIGGIPPINGWDNVDEWRAQLKGWRTMSFPEIAIYQLRETGGVDGVIRGRVLQGENSYYLGYNIVMIVGRGFYRAVVDKPYIIGGLAIIWGYLKSLLKRKPRYDDEEIREYLSKVKKSRWKLWLR